MDPVLLTVLIAVATFLVILGALLVIRVLRQRRRKGLLFRKDFGRHTALPGVGIDDVRKPDVATRRERRPVERHGRIYAFGLVAAGILGTLAMRLWSLQMISGSTYQKQAEQNMTSEASIPAPRGRLLDRNGEVLVGNRASLCISAPRGAADDPVLVQLLALVCGLPRGIVKSRLRNDSLGMQANRVVATDVSMEQVAFIREHQRIFPGVEVVERTVRVYPHGALAAHVLGYIGPVADADLLLPNSAISYEGDDYVGKSGAEFAFEGVLQGTRGVRTYRVDVAGNPIALLDETPPLNGSDVRLTIDLNLQRETDRILAEVIVSSQQKGFVFANAGALVCIDVEDGGILASSSYPSFDPERLALGISEELWSELTREGSGNPLNDRVIAGLYPAASTFKAFTGLAGLERGVIGPGMQTTCNGLWEGYGEQWAQKCWIYPSGHGTLGLEEAINQSCDVFFYTVGAAFYERWEEASDEERTNELQDFLRTWGFGSPTGVDIPGEADGRVPDAEWKRAAFSATPEGAQWQPGDMTSMCIGQGDILVTPLQMANGYAGLARRRMLKPHLFHQVLNDEGEVVVAGAPQDSEVQPVIDEAAIARIA
ncbi:MAG: penicillin-binding protein 2, partial [Coriobacteriales bacterium]|nr:penicillin-binding protein 2 [Coriobacteriales bacterium]